MLITELAEVLKDHLNDTVAVWSPDNLGVSVVNAFDPLIEKLQDLRVFVVPGQNIYNIETSPRGRGSVRSHVMFPTLILAVAAPFKEIVPDSEYGVASWEEAKTLLNLQERIENQALYFKPEGMSLSSMEAIPANEINTDFRNFVVATTLVYEKLGCNLSSEQDSLSLGLRDDTEWEGTRASFRSRLLSDRKQGRR